MCGSGPVPHFLRLRRSACLSFWEGGASFQDWCLEFGCWLLVAGCLEEFFGQFYFQGPKSGVCMGLAQSVWYLFIEMADGRVRT